VSIFPIYLRTLYVRSLSNLGGLFVTRKLTWTVQFTKKKRQLVGQLRNYDYWNAKTAHVHVKMCPTENTKNHGLHIFIIIREFTLILNAIITYIYIIVFRHFPAYIIHEFDLYRRFIFCYTFLL